MAGAEVALPTRREFLAAGAAVTASTTYHAIAQQAGPGKPNILFILADDLCGTSASKGK